jgi:hypothetical protein
MGFVGINVIVVKSSRICLRWSGTVQLAVGQWMRLKFLCHDKSVPESI